MSKTFCQPDKGGGFEDRKYRPDLYSPDYDLCLEHFGIDREGKTAPFIDAVEYNETITWKCHRCSRDRARLISTPVSSGSSSPAGASNGARVG